ncbi:ECF transporter S component [Bifidobacterium thermophilum]|nr:ECF transporter S component [Bifidobacterium thermophilum]
MSNISSNASVATATSTGNSATVQPEATPVTAGRPSLRWRVVDIAVASVIGVASALIFWLVSLIYSLGVGDLIGLVMPGFQGIYNGLWLFAGPLAAVIVRKPGAATYTELLGGVIESLMGNQWTGMDTFSTSLMQGAFAELAFLIVLYRVWNAPITMLSGAFAGVAVWLHDIFMRGQAFTGQYITIYLVTSVISGIVFAGIVVWYLYRAIARTGALDKFASGREVRATA